MQGDYSAAVAALNTLQSNFSIVDAIRKSGKGMNKNAIPEMIEWVKKLGYEPADFDRLKAVHVAGTKGKGSTSSFVSSILGQYVAEGKVTKTGLYTSPHLRFVRERIQIDNRPLTEEQFAKYFFETWNRLEAAAKAAGHPDSTSKETKPVYFRFLTLMALHTYISEGVDAAVIECGIGGEFDSTNILVKPSVTAVTSLGIDHVAMLGDTIDSIAWHKAGVFKPGVPAFSAPQPEEAIRVLHERAAERNTDLQVVKIHPELDNIKLGLAADFQKTNASVAIAAAAAYLRRVGVEDLPTPTYLPTLFRKGLENVHLGGRCETRTDTTTQNLKWHIDGGHTLESIELAARWFGSLISSSADPSTRILIFNQQTRDASSLALKLHETLASALEDQKPFSHAFFCTNTTYAESGFRPDLTSINTNASDVETLSVQNALAETWRGLDKTCQVRVLRTVEEAVKAAREVAGQQEEEVMVLATGSLHLVGGVVEVLEGGNA
ncbi:FolC bifunctional protein [Aureobasidium sp. EXF-10728]|nr:FolC bifunctional protein [Aureobasidium sp. EXF-10728]